MKPKHEREILNTLQEMQAKFERWQIVEVVDRMIGAGVPQKRRKYSPQVERKLLVLVLRDGMSVLKAARHLNMSNTYVRAKLTDICRNANPRCFKKGTVGFPYYGPPIGYLREHAGAFIDGLDRGAT